MLPRNLIPAQFANYAAQGRNIHKLSFSQLEKNFQIKIKQFSMFYIGCTEINNGWK